MGNLQKDEEMARAGGTNKRTNKRKDEQTNESPLCSTDQPSGSLPKKKVR